MSRLIETIRLLDGKFYNLSYHNERMRRSSSVLFGKKADADLEEILLARAVPKDGLYKCRIVYDDRVHEVAFDRYIPRAIRRIKVVTDDEISYEHKFEDRTALNRLFALRGDCDDVLIIKNSLVTDSSYANIAFRAGRRWFTPERPLLKGTIRQKLLDENKIHEKEIRAGDIRSFDSFKLINAMLEFQSPEIEVSAIVF